jgi:hypothetical protein
MKHGVNSVQAAAFQDAAVAAAVLSTASHTDSAALSLLQLVLVHGGAWHVLSCAVHHPGYAAVLQ